MDWLKVQLDHQFARRTGTEGIWRLVNEVSGQVLSCRAFRTLLPVAVHLLSRLTKTRQDLDRANFGYLESRQKVRVLAPGPPFLRVSLCEMPLGTYFTGKTENRCGVPKGTVQGMQSGNMWANRQYVHYAGGTMSPRQCCWVNGVFVRAHAKRVCIVFGSQSRALGSNTRSVRRCSLNAPACALSWLFGHNHCKHHCCTPDPHHSATFAFIGLSPVVQ